jgi:NitT/TauT family transport system substrate-binding protein
MRNRPRFILGLVAGTLGILGAIAPAAAEHLVFIFPLAPTGEETVFYLAQAQGRYEKAGLDMEFEDGRGSGYVMQVLAAGHGDLGEGSLVPMVVAREKGAPLRSIGLFWPKGDMALVVPRASSIKSGADLRGKRFVLSTAGPWPLVMDQFLGNLHLTDKDVGIENVNGAALYSTYTSGRVDGMMTVANAFVQVDPLRPSQIVLASTLGVDMPGEGLIASDKVLAAKHDAIGKFVDIIRQTIEYMYDGHEAEAVDATLKARPDLSKSRDVLLTEALLAKDFLRTPGTQGHPFGWQSREEWAKQIAFMTAAKIIGPGHMADEFFTNALIDASTK